MSSNSFHSLKNVHFSVLYNLFYAGVRSAINSTSTSPVSVGKKKSNKKMFFSSSFFILFFKLTEKRRQRVRNPSFASIFRPCSSIPPTNSWTSELYAPLASTLIEIVEPSWQALSLRPWAQSAKQSSLREQNSSHNYKVGIN